MKLRSLFVFLLSGILFVGSALCGKRVFVNSSKGERIGRAWVRNKARFSDKSSDENREIFYNLICSDPGIKVLFKKHTKDKTCLNMKYLWFSNSFIRDGSNELENLFVDKSCIEEMTEEEEKEKYDSDCESMVKALLKKKDLQDFCKRVFKPNGNIGDIMKRQDLR